MNKILLVEDDPLVSTLYSNKLAAAGYNVEIAVNGQEGFYRIHEQNFTAVVLDLMLPEMNGLNILRKIRAQKQFHALPIFVLTNAYLGETIAHAREAGATEVFSKAATTPRLLVDAVHRYFSGATPASSRGAAKPAKSAAAEEPDGSLTDKFLAQTSDAVSLSRRVLQNLAKATNDSIRITFLRDLYRPVHGMASGAAATDLQSVSRISAALEALVSQLEANPRQLNASLLRTLASAIDFIGSICAAPRLSLQRDPSTARILVVDDDPISRRAVTHALEKTNLKGTSVESPDAALGLMKTTSFDLVISDVNMPGMDGFEMCKSLRTLPENASTPVVFVTSLTDFESRAKSTLSGGSDLIAKPFLPLELGLKALMLVLKSRLEVSR